MPYGTAKNLAIDKTDREILKHLEFEARLSFTELARRVALSPNALAERVRRLERARVISGYRLVIDRSRLGLKLIADVDVKLRADTPGALFESAARRIPGIERMTLTTGSFDYTLRTACKDEKDLVRLIEALRAAVPLAETYSRLVLHEVDLPVHPRSVVAEGEARSSAEVG